MLTAILWSAAVTFALVGLLLAARACANAGYSAGYYAGRQALRDEAERVMLERRYQAAKRRSELALKAYREALSPEDGAN